MLKRILTLLIAIAMVLSLCAVAGCKKDGGKTQGGAANVQGSDEVEEEYFLDMPAELKGTTVKFATWIDHAKTDTAICLSGFEETTGMKYELVHVNQHDYIQKMSGLIASGQAPDVVVENGDFPKTLNLLQPLSLETNGLDPKNPFWDQNVSERFNIGGKYYLVNGAKSSWNMVGGMTYYNKSMLEDYGIKTPGDYVYENNWTVDTMWTLMKQIQSSCELSRPGTSIDFDNWCTLYGGGQMDWDEQNDKFVNTINKPETVAAIKYLVKGKDEGILRIIDNHDDDIATGKIALEICGAYGLRKSPGWFYTMDVEDLGFAVLPKVNKADANYPSTSSIRSYGICKGARNAKGAAYFLRYFLNEDHYDIDQIFKNEEAKEMYYELRKTAQFNLISFTPGVNKVVSDLDSPLSTVGDLIDGTESQVSINLAKSSGEINSAINLANKVIEDFKKTQ